MGLCFFIVVDKVSRNPSPDTCQNKASQVTSMIAEVADQSAPAAWWECTEDWAGSFKPITISAAGLCCTDYSPLGKQARDAGTTEMYHHIWQVDRLRAAELGAESVFFTECSSLYPAQTKQAAPMTEQFHVVFIQASPDLLGFPVRRPRMFSAGINRAEYLWCGPSTPQEVQAEWNAIFGRLCTLTGDAFFCAPVPEVQAWAQRTATARKTSIPLHMMNQSIESLLPFLLPTGGVKRKFQYDELQPDRCALDGSFLFDLDHNPGYGPGCGSLFPSMSTHPRVFSHKQGRLALPAEYLSAQGVDMYADLSGDRGISPLRDVFNSVTDTEACFLAGNSLHVPTYLCFMIYVLGNLRPRADFIRMPPQLGNGAAKAEAEAETDETEVERGRARGSSSSALSETPLRSKRFKIV